MQFFISCPADLKYKYNIKYQMFNPIFAVLIHVARTLLIKLLI